MLESLTLLLGLQLAGEVLVRLLGLPLPGPVVGMVLLFLVLAALGRVPAPLEQTARGLLQHLSLLFVPAGVGVISYLPLVAREWLPIGVALVGSTLITIAVTGLIMSRLGRGTEEERADDR
jgi:putative effector of murein hydrolase LrgA (UPF0299 family)